MAATVFGKISEKTNIAKVSKPVAIATPASPYKRIPIMVAMAEALIFTKLLKIRIKLNKVSGLSSNFSAFCAPLLPCSDRKRKRYLLTESKPVSEPEKYADKTKQITSVINKLLRGILSKGKSFCELIIPVGYHGCRRNNKGESNSPSFSKSIDCQNTQS